MWPSPGARRSASPSAILLALVFVAALSRLLLQAIVMPPYAGLDEAYHVARVWFVSHEGRNPSRVEPSIPAYLERSIAADDSAPWSFAALGPRWPESVARRRAPWPNPGIEDSGGGALGAGNYQAQHPSAYYSIAGRALALAPKRRQLDELLALRVFSAVLGSLAVFAAALIGARTYGRAGLLAAALLGSFPTWVTLVGRASNDALAVGAASLAIAFSTKRQLGPHGIVAEALLWSLAVATKATTWPLLVVIPIAAVTRRWPVRRLAPVALSACAALVLTALDLQARTGSPLGDQGLTTGALAPTSVPGSAAIPKMAKVLFASAIWPGAQHGNALTVLGMALFTLPLLAIFGVLGCRATRRPRVLPLLLGACAAFAAAQAIHAWGFVREAIKSGRSEPLGGFEGWYLWTLGPLVLSILVGWSFANARRHASLPALFLVWTMAWDLRIHEGALFRDYAGETGPEAPSSLFRWGPLPSHDGAVDRLELLSATGLPRGYRCAFRTLNVAALITLGILTLRRRPRRPRWEPATGARLT